MTASREDIVKSLLRGSVLFLGGMLVGAVGVSPLLTPGDGAVAAQTANQYPQSTEEAIEAIKGHLPDQAHAMQDVGYHFANLWFAAQKQNWPLADFYAKETRSHLRWAVRIIPRRKDAAGQIIDLEALLQAFENSPLKQIEEAISATDTQAFEKAYRFGLESCYSCHKASDKPFIRPQVPTAPEATIINFEPTAEWPK